MTALRWLASCTEAWTERKGVVDASPSSGVTLPSLRFILVGAVPVTTFPPPVRKTLRRSYAEGYFIRYSPPEQLHSGPVGDKTSLTFF